MAGTTMIQTLKHPGNSRHAAQHEEAGFHAAMAAKGYTAKGMLRTKFDPWIYCPTAGRKINRSGCESRQAGRHLLAVIDEQCSRCPRGCKEGVQ